MTTDAEARAKIVGDLTDLANGMRKVADSLDRLIEISHRLDEVLAAGEKEIET